MKHDTDAVTETIAYMVDELRDAARWRREKAEQYPNDWRNENAAEMLEKMAKEALALDPGLPLIQELERLQGELSRLSDLAANRSEPSDLDDFSRELSELTRGVGFSSGGGGDSAMDFLESLVGVYRSAAGELVDHLVEVGISEPESASVN